MDKKLISLFITGIIVTSFYLYRQNATKIVQLSAEDIKLAQATLTRLDEEKEYKSNHEEKLVSAVNTYREMDLSKIKYEINRAKTEASTEEFEWRKINIPDIGNILLPSILEIRSGLEKQNKEDLKKVILNQQGITLTDEAKTIIQPQKGNSYFENTLPYFRIIISKEKSEGLGGNLYFKENEMSEANLSELNKIYKKTTFDGIELLGTKITEWENVQYKKVNNLSSVKYEYTRKDESMAFGTHVEVYLFFGMNHSYRMMISYKVNEVDKWIEIIPKVLNSFEISSNN
jgi:hypothetical protein